MEHRIQTQTAQLRATNAELSITNRQLEDFGRIAGLSDPAEFEACVSRSDSLAVISEDIATVRRLGGRGTPTVIVNGQLLNGVPDSAGLAAIVRRLRREASK